MLWPEEPGNGGSARAIALSRRQRSFMAWFAGGQGRPRHGAAGGIGRAAAIAALAKAPQSWCPTLQRPGPAEKRPFA